MKPVYRAHKGWYASASLLYCPNPCLEAKVQHQGKVPSIEDPLVSQFLKKWNLAGTPVLLKYVDCGYDAAMCHVSAKHKAVSEGGQRVHGWALWLFGSFLVADHHSVWQPTGGVLIDVTPPSNGGLEILFVKDETARIELDGDHIQLFTQRTVGTDAHWMWNGQPSDYSNWSCPLDKEDLVKYSANLKLSVNAILTDSVYG